MKVLTVAAKSLRLFARDRMGFFWTFLFPLLLITIFSLMYSGMSEGSIGIKLLVVQDDNSVAGNAYFAVLDNVFDIEKVENIQSAEAEVLGGKVVAAVVIPSGFAAVTPQGFAPGRENVILIYDETRGDISGTVINIVEGITKGFFGQQTPLTVQSIQGEYKKWDAVQHFIPGIGIMMILMIGGMGVSNRIVMERKTGTFKRNLLAPIGKATFLGGELLCGFVIGCMQVLVFFGLGVLAFGLKIAGSILLVGFISALVILMSVSFGLLVSTFAKSVDAASAAVQAFTFPASALGGLWVPIEIMPGFLQSAASVFPTRYAMQAFQDVIVRGRGLFEIMPSLTILAGFAVVFFAMGWMFFRWKE